MEKSNQLFVKEITEIELTASPTWALDGGSFSTKTSTSEPILTAS